MSQEKDEQVVQDIVTYAENEEFAQAANAIKTRFGIVERWALAGTSRYDAIRRRDRIRYLWRLLSGEQLLDRKEERQQLLSSTQTARARRRLVFIAKQLDIKTYRSMVQKERQRAGAFHKLATYCLWLRLPLVHSADDFVTPRTVHQ